MADPDLFASAPRHEVSFKSAWYRVYDSIWGYGEPNPGFGDARFSPFDALSTAGRVPSLYLARSPTAALLETVFHDIDDTASVVYEHTLRERLIVAVTLDVSSSPLSLVDLRDNALESLGVNRTEVASSPAEHYPCTRRIARELHATGAAGIIWHSRQAELRDGHGELKRYWSCSVTTPA